MRWNYRLVSALLVLTSIIGISFALYLEHVQGLEPCPLCVFQRIGLIGMGFIALIAFIHNPISNAKLWSWFGLFGRSFADENGFTASANRFW